MNRSRTIVLSLSLVAAFAFTAAAQDAPPAENPPQAPHGYVLIPEDAWTAFDNQPEQAFEKARDAFNDHDFDASAQAIRQSAVFVEVEASRATTKGQQPLMQCVRDLNQLADSVEKGHVTTVNELNKTFSRTHYALAKHHYQLAADAWQNEGSAAANHDFKAAAQNLKWGLKWTGKKVSAATDKTISGADNLADRIKSGGKWAAQEMGEGLKNLGGAIQSAADRMQSNQ